VTLRNECGPPDIANLPACASRRRPGVKTGPRTRRRHRLGICTWLDVVPADARATSRLTQEGSTRMRASFGTVLSLVIAAGCSHHGKGTTEDIKETAHAEADTAGGTLASDQSADCPMQVMGTAVRTEETTSGPALAFTTTGDVDDLRMRVRRMAANENRMMQSPQSAAQAMAPTKPKTSVAEDAGFPSAASGSSKPESAAVPSMYSPDSHEAPGGSTSTQGSLLHDSEGTPGTTVKAGTGSQPALARAENTESGARLVFVIEDASQLERVRDHVQTSAQVLAAGRCLEGAVQKANGASGGYQRPAAGGY
jgi:hypothetical protein